MSVCVSRTAYFRSQLTKRINLAAAREERSKARFHAPWSAFAKSAQGVSPELQYTLTSHSGLIRSDIAVLTRG